MYDVSIPMALVDYIPVVLFGWAAVLLQRDLYHRMPKYAFACFAAVNWAEQGVNCLGQGLLLAGVLCLHRAGLREKLTDQGGQ